MSTTPDDTALIVGRTYHVAFEDCCVNGSFTAELTGVELDEEGDIDAYIFNRGRAGSLWGGWTFTPADPA